MKITRTLWLKAAKDLERAAKLNRERATAFRRYARKGARKAGWSDRLYAAQYATNFAVKYFVTVRRLRGKYVGNDTTTTANP